MPTIRAFRVQQEGRFGIGRFTTREEIDFALGLITDKVRWLREMSPLYEMVKEGIDLSKVQWTAH